MAWIERQRHLLDFALSSLWRRKGKNAALFAVYTLVVFLLASVLLCAHALRREAAVLLAGAPEIVVQRTMMGRHDLVPVAYAEKIFGIPGVRIVRPRLWGYYYDAVTRANYTFQVAADGSGTRGSVSIGEGVSRARRVTVGDRMRFHGSGHATKVFSVEKVFPAESALVSSDLIVVGEEDFRDLFGVPEGYATDLAVTVANRREVATVADKVARLFRDTRPILRDEILRTYDAVFGWRSALLIVLFAATGLSFAILAWDKASGLSAEERREIGILKAVGWDTSDVLLLKFYEGIAVSLPSFLAGFLLAYAHVFLGGSALIVPVLKGWSTLYPQFHLAPYVSVAQVLILFFLTVIPYAVATVIPSWRAAIIDPDVVMREAG
jgi:ABC-type lipoprotein release transport system permease subunit